MSVSEESVMIKRHKPSNELKTKISFLALLAVSALAPRMLGQETPRGGIVTVPKAAFNITALEGWVLDTESGKHQYLLCVFYSKSSSWADAKTVMYETLASAQCEV